MRVKVDGRRENDGVVKSIQIKDLHKLLRSLEEDVLFLINVRHFMKTRMVIHLFLLLLIAK